MEEFTRHVPLSGDHDESTPNTMSMICQKTGKRQDYKDD